MKISTIAVNTAFAASTVNAYSVSLWADNSYKGTKVTFTTFGRHYLSYVCVKLMTTVLRTKRVVFSFNADSYKWSSPVGDGCCIREQPDLPQPGLTDASADGVEIQASATMDWTRDTGVSRSSPNKPLSPTKLTTRFRPVTQQRRSQP